MPTRSRQSKPAAKSVPAKTTNARVRGRSGTRDRILSVAEEARSTTQRVTGQIEAPKVASMKDVERIAGQLSDAFLHCRDFGHQWRMANAERRGRVRTRTMYCPSCKFNKHQTFDSRGHLVEQKFDYPEGYLIKGMGRITGDTKGLIRLESIDRLIDSKSKTKAS